MAHHIAFYPTEQHSKCANCPFFTGFNGEERGWCEAFKKVFKRHNLRTLDCDKEIESLLKQLKTCTVSVHLITEAVCDDGSGHAVCVDSQTVEVTVAQPIKALVEMEISSRKDLQGWQVATFWQKQLDGDFEI